MRAYWVRKREEEAANPEAHAKQLEERQGKTWSVETCAKISASCKGRKMTTFNLTKMCAAQKLAQGNAGARARASERAKQQWADPNYKKKALAVMKFWQTDPVIREKASVSNRLLWEDPLYREERTAAIRQAAVRRQADPVCREKNIEALKKARAARKREKGNPA
jgi:hypothetical protein